MGRRFDRPFSDADSDAHAVGNTSKIGVNGVHELFTPRKLRCPARFIRQPWMDNRKLLENELMDSGRAEWTAGYVRGLLVVVGVDWRRLPGGWVASSGFEWRRMAQEDTDGEVPRVFMVMASSGVEEVPAHRRSLFDRQQAASCFRCLSHDGDYCDSFSMAVLCCSDATPSGAHHSAS